MHELAEFDQFFGLIVLVIGVFTAFSARAVLSRLTNKYSQNAGVLASFVSALRPFAFWSILAFTIVLSIWVLEVPQATALFDEVLAYLPQLFSAGLILLIGHFVGVGLRQLLTRHRGTVVFPPRGAYWLVITPSLIAAVQQLGIDVTFLAELTLVAFGVSLAAIGITFALGARDYVSNLIARRELDGYREGDKLRIEDIEGTVVELRRTGVVLATSEGLVTVPASRFSSAPVIRLVDTP